MPKQMNAIDIELSFVCSTMAQASHLTTIKIVSKMYKGKL